MKNLITPVLSLPSNKNGHSASHGLGKLQDLVRRGLFTAAENEDGTIIVTTATRTYNLPSASPLLVRTVADIIANGRGVDAELEWFEANCVTSNQFKLFKNPEPDTPSEKSKKGFSAVTYSPVVTVRAEDWLNNTIRLNVDNLVDASIYNKIVAALSNEKAKKEELAAVLLEVQRLLVSPDQALAFKEIETRQALEQSRFDFLSSIELQGIDSVVFEGAVQQGNFRLTLSVADYAAARNLLKEYGYTVATPKFLEDGETLYLFINAPKELAPSA